MFINRTVEKKHWPTYEFSATHGNLFDSNNVDNFISTHFRKNVSISPVSSVNNTGSLQAGDALR